MLNKDYDFRLKDGGVDYNLMYFKAHKWLYPLWKKNRDAIEGEDRVKKHAKSYLIQTSIMKEDDQAWKDYVKMASFFEAVGRTKQGMEGLIFKEEPSVNVPSALDNQLMYFSNNNETAKDFAKRLTGEQLTTNMNVILIDYPSTDGRQLTVADAERMNLAPYATLYQAESIIDIRYEVQNNKTALKMLIVHETIQESINEFEYVEIDQIRVLDIDEMGNYRQRIYRKDATKDQYVKFDDDVYPLINGQMMEFIPAVTVSGEGLNFNPSKPILNGLTNLNLKMFSNSADYEFALHEVCNPTPVFKGLTVDPETGDIQTPKLGILAGIFLNPDGDAFYMQADGVGIEHMREAIKDKMEQMALMGARIIAADKKGVETAQSQEIYRAGENAVLANLADNISSAIEECFFFMGLWLNVPESELNDIQYKLNTNYLANMSFADAKILAETWIMGAITEQEMFEKFKQGGLISPEKSYEEHQEEKVNEIPPEVRSNTDVTV